MKIQKHIFIKLKPKIKIDGNNKCHDYKNKLILI